jgi:hypothetical protein
MKVEQVKRSDGSRGLMKMWEPAGFPFEDMAMDQIRNMASMPFIHKHVAVMPDAHAGKGSTVGTVIATKGAVIPAAVGVDIGCGMMAVRLSIKADVLPDNLFAARDGDRGRRSRTAAARRKTSSRASTWDRGTRQRAPAEINATAGHAIELRLLPARSSSRSTRIAPRRAKRCRSSLARSAPATTSSRSPRMRTATSG